MPNPDDDMTISQSFPIDVVVLFKMLFLLNSPKTQTNPTDQLRTPPLQTDSQGQEQNPVVSTGILPIDVVVLFKMLYSLKNRKSIITVPTGIPKVETKQSDIPIPTTEERKVDESTITEPVKTPTTTEPVKTPTQNNLLLKSAVSDNSTCHSGSTSITRKDDHMEWRTILCDNQCSQKVEKHFDLICFKGDYAGRKAIPYVELKPNQKYAVFGSPTDKFGSFVFVFQEKMSADVQNAMNENCNSLLFQGTTGVLLQGVSSNAPIKYDGKDYTAEEFIRDYERKPGFEMEKIQIHGSEKFLVKTDDDLPEKIQEIEKLGSNRINETCLLYREILFELKKNAVGSAFYETRAFQYFTPIAPQEYDIYTSYYGVVDKTPLEKGPIEFAQPVSKGASPPKSLNGFHYRYLGQTSLDEIRKELQKVNGPDRSVITGEPLEKIEQKGGATTTLGSEGVLFRYEQDNKIYISNPVHCKGLAVFPPDVILEPVILSSPQIPVAPFVAPIVAPVSPVVASVVDREAMLKKIGVRPESRNGLVESSLLENINKKREQLIKPLSDRPEKPSVETLQQQIQKKREELNKTGVVLKGGKKTRKNKRNGK